MKILKKNYSLGRGLPSWYAINLDIAFSNLGSLLASLISLINFFQDFIKIFSISRYLKLSK
jgi:hypothetical protein